MDYRKINKDLWNRWAELHVETPFYDVEAFRNGASTLIGPEVELLGDLKGRSVLHLQCHFGQDTLSLARQGANVTGVDLADRAIAIARRLSSELKIPAEFVCADILELGKVLQRQYDIVYTSYGVLVWLQDLDAWAAVVHRFLKPGGRFVLVEFHPFLATMNESLDGIEYSYFNTGVVLEDEAGSYAAPEALHVTGKSATWDHSLGEVYNSLKNKGLVVEQLEEYPYSPYKIMENMVRTERGYEVNGLEGRIPLLYSMTAVKPA